MSTVMHCVVVAWHVGRSPEDEVAVACWLVGGVSHAAGDDAMHAAITRRHLHSRITKDMTRKIRYTVRHISRNMR